MVVGVNERVQYINQESKFKGEPNSMTEVWTPLLQGSSSAI